MGGIIILLGYALVGAVVLALCAIFYLRSTASRRTYRCPQCDELIKVELMRASRCNVCGAPLDYPGDSPRSPEDEYDGPPA